MSFSSGFRAGYSVVEAAQEKRKRKKREEEIAKIQSASVNEVDRAVPSKDGMTQLNPDDTPVTQKKYEFMGQTFDQRPDETEIERIRRSSIADVISKADPIKGMQYEKSSYEFAQKKRQDAEEQGYKKDRYKAFQDTTFAKQQMDYNNAMKDYQTQLQDYEKAKAEGKNVTAPTVPQKPDYNLSDMLDDQVKLIETDAKYGKLNSDKLMNFQNSLRNMKEEGYVDALKAAQAGSSLDQIAEQFNQTGKIQFDPSQVMSDEVIKTKGKPDTRVIQYRDPEGNVRTINTLAELESFDKADKFFERYDKERRADIYERGQNRADQRLQFDREKYMDEKTRKDAEADAAVAIYKQQNPGATKKELEAVRLGVVKPKSKETSKGFDVQTNSDGIMFRENKDTGTIEFLDPDTMKVTGIVPVSTPEMQDIASDPRAIEIKNNPDMSREEKLKALRALGYK